MNNRVFSCYKKNRRFTIKEKLDFIEYAKKKVIKKLLIKLEFLLKLSEDGKKNELKFLEIKDPLKRITLHPGRIENKLPYSL